MSIRKSAATAAMARCHRIGGSAAAAMKPTRPTILAVRRSSWSAMAPELCASTMRSVRVLVTGATGKVGHAVAHALHARGDEVVVLARDPAKAGALLPDGVSVARGDVTEPDSLRAAVSGCELVFNAMGIPEQFVRDEGVFERVDA